MLVQLADEIPPLSLFPPPHHSLLSPQLWSCNSPWDFAGNGTFKMNHLWKKNFRKLLCFSKTDSCGLAYSFAPCAITSEKLSRQKSVMLKQEQDWRRDTKVVSRLCCGRDLHHRFPEGCSPPAVLRACWISPDSAVVISAWVHFCATAMRMDFAAKMYPCMAFRPCLTWWDLRHAFWRLLEQAGRRAGPICWSEALLNWLSYCFYFLIMTMQCKRRVTMKYQSYSQRLENWGQDKNILYFLSYFLLVELHQQ